MMSSQDPSAERGTSPFFVVGAPRSGTTILRLMLGHHSRICRCEEMEFVTPALNGRDEPLPMDEYKALLETDRGFKLSGYVFKEHLDFFALARDFFDQRRSIDGKPIVGATVHHDFEFLPRIWPNSRFIYLNRDPRDVSRSCVQMGWVGTVWNAADYWLAANDSWRRLVESQPAENLIEIHFEDLVSNTSETLERVCQFLGVDFEPSMVGIERDTTYTRPDPDSAKSWRTSASNREIALAEARIGLKRLQEAGYQPSGIAWRYPGPLKRSALAFEDAFNRVRARVAMFGFWLWALGVVSRRLPSKRLHDSVRIRLDAVINENMK